jgi:hypothetical protein
MKEEKKKKTGGNTYEYAAAVVGFVCKMNSGSKMVRIEVRIMSRQVNKENWGEDDEVYLSCLWLYGHVYFENADGLPGQQSTHDAKMLATRPLHG